MINFIHKFLNPHCPDCIAEKEYNKLCQNCESLKQQLAVVNQQNTNLLQTIINFNRLDGRNQIEVGNQYNATTEPILSKNIPWQVRRQMLEEEDRTKAKILRKTTEDIEKLEKDLNLGSDHFKFEPNEGEGVNEV